jgi:hypothetical protein
MHHFIQSRIKKAPSKQMFLRRTNKSPPSSASGTNPGLGFLSTTHPILGLAEVGLTFTIAITNENGAFSKSTEKKANAVADSQQPLPADPNAITKTFIDKGVTTCAANIDKTTNVLGSGGVTGAMMFIPSEKPNKQLVSTSLLVVDKDKKSAYSSASFAPTGKGCGMVYDAITWWPEKCQDVANRQFAGKKIVGNLKQNISVLDLGPSAGVFLMPTGDGCVSIKKEVGFH